MRVIGSSQKGDCSHDDSRHETIDNHTTIGV